MDFKSPVNLEHISSSLSFKSRVICAFGLGVVASLLVFSLLPSVNAPSTITSLSSSSSFFSWVFSINNPPSNSTDTLLAPPNVNVTTSSDLGTTHFMNSSDLLGGQPTSDKTQDVNSSKSSFSGKNSDLDNAHFKNSTEESQNLTLGADHASVEQITIENAPLNNGSAESTTSFPISDKSQAGISSKSSFSEDVSDVGSAHSKNSTGESQNPNLELVITENATLNTSAKDERKDLGSTAEENRNVSDDSGSVKVQGEGEMINEKCDIFYGRWVRDEREAFYDAGSCPYIDRGFNCHKNGRPDDDFLRWRWQPNDCDIPRLNATDFLVRLKGQRLVFVGDSLNRNMWQSLVCILRHSVENKDRVYEAARRPKFKLTGYYSIIFQDYKCSIEYVRSPYLVRGSYDDERVRLDLMDEATKAYRKADIVVFNTGHWWTHEKPSKGVDYYQEGHKVYPLLEVMEAYKRALTTWASWVDKYINFKRTQVVFRGYSPTHYRGRQWNSGGQCHKETEPIFNETFLPKYPPKMRAFEEVMEKMKTPVIYLNISRLTEYRKDGHPSIYRKTYNTVQEQIAGEKSPDCSHWCLPGIPDTWNELLYASLLLNGKGSWMP